MSRLFILLGIVLILTGVAIAGFNRLGLPLGRLPGDLSYRGKNFTLFAPLGTSFLISLLLSLALYVASRIRR